MKAKAWQLFILFVAPIISLFIAIFSANKESKILFSVIPILMTVSMVPFFIWLMILGVKLNSLLPDGVRPKVAFFKVAISYGTLYLLFFGFAMSFATSMPQGGQGIMAVILPLHLLAMLCMVYTNYFVAKNFVMAIGNQKPSFFDFSGPFFLLYFYPLGVWFIQPKINEIFKQDC